MLLLGAISFVKLMKENTFSNQVRRLLSSRWSAIPLGILYGLFIFWYVGFLVLDDPKDVSHFADEGNDTVSDQNMKDLPMDMNFPSHADQKTKTTKKPDTTGKQLYNKRNKNIFKVENR